MGRHVLAGKLGSLRGFSRPGFCIFFIVAALCDSTGCTRNFYRKRADVEVNDVLAEKDHYPDWKIDQWHVYPDPRARFADPTDPDHPPMPPDDPAAWKQSPQPQKPGECGTARVVGTGYLDLLNAWNEKNRAEREKTASQETGLGGEPAETAGLPGSKKTEGDSDQTAPAKDDAYTSTILRTEPRPGGPQPYLLNLEQACELAVINSREYQDAREDLYLAALPVTLERFSFAAQFFAAEQALRQWAGSETPATNNWTLNSNAGFAKLFSTGGLLLFNFANQTVFNLGGAAHPVTSESTINLDLIQPLLQGGGKAVTLEPLTQAERNLVYQIRNYARFRKTLYVAIAGGGGGGLTGGTFQPIGVIAASTFSVGQPGLSSSGLVPGLIRDVPFQGTPGLQVSPPSSGALFLQTALTAPVSGYLSTLLQASQIQVDKYNIRILEGFLRLGKALQEGGDISQLQTDQFEQQLLRGRQSLLTDQQNYLQNIDQFKLQLGLPTDTFIELDDSPFRPLNEQFRRYEELFRAFKTTSELPSRIRAPDMAPQVRAEMRRLLTSSPFVQGTQFQQRIDTRWAAWEKLSDAEIRKQLARYNQERNALLDKQVALEMKGQTVAPADQQRLEGLVNEIAVGEMELGLREYESQPWKAIQDPETKRRRQQALFGHVSNSYTVVLIEARNERLAIIRAQWPVLSRVCVDGVDLLQAELDDAEAAAAQHALIHRLDLMNVRATNVDAWRQLRVFANALLAPLTVNYSLTSSTPPGANRPLDFNNTRTLQTLSLNTQLPLVRTIQRNNYRASLISYQRSRRVLQRAEDQVAFDVRQELILLRQTLEQYRIQARQVELAFLTVDNSLDTLQAPPAPTGAAGAGFDQATRAASLTNQLIQAQTSLYNALFTMTSIWITYLNTRSQLYRDMELLPLDSRGVWIDEVAACECPPNAAGTPPAASNAAPSGTGSGPEGQPSNLPDLQPAAPAPGTQPPPR